jgi:hypothetical protein
MRSGWPGPIDRYSILWVATDDDGVCGFSLKQCVSQHGIVHGIEGGYTKQIGLDWGQWLVQDVEYECAECGASIVGLDYLCSGCREQ